MAALSATVVFACGALLRPKSPIGLDGYLLAVAGAIVCAGTIVIGALSRGISIGALVHGVILDPAKHPGCSYPIQRSSSRAHIGRGGFLLHRHPNVAYQDTSPE